MSPNVYFLICSSQLFLWATYCEHAVMQILTWLISEHAEFQVPGPLWSRLTNDQTMGLIVFVWLQVMALPVSEEVLNFLEACLRARFYMCTNFDSPELLALGMAEVNLFSPLTAIILNSSLSTCIRDYLKLTLWNHLTIQTKLFN